MFTPPALGRLIVVPDWRIAVRAIILTCGLGLAVSAHAQTTVFDFVNDPQGTPTTLTETAGSMSATFSSPADINGGGFQVEAIPFSTLTGNVLHDRGPSGQENIPLNISFNQLIYSISLNFATNDALSASPLALTAFLSGQQVGTGSATGIFQASSYPEGVLTFASASPFNSVTLTTTPAPDFAVNNIQVSTTPVPEASTTISFGLLLALGAGGLVITRRKRGANPV